LGKYPLPAGDPYLTIEDGAFNNYGGEINTVQVLDSVNADINKLGFNANNIVQGGSELL
jgi:hypothetical protein